MATKIRNFRGGGGAGGRGGSGGVGICIIIQETPQVLFTLKDIQGEADFHLLKLDKFFIGPVSLIRLRFTPGEPSFDQTATIIGR